MLHEGYRTTQDIVIQALIDRIRVLESYTPGTVGKPREIIEKLIRRGEVMEVPTNGDPLAQFTFQLVKR